MEFPQGLEGSGYEQVADSGTELEDAEDEASLAKRRRLWVEANTYTLEQYHERFPRWARVNQALRHRYWGRTNLRNTRKFIKKFRRLDKCPFLRDFRIFIRSSIRPARISHGKSRLRWAIRNCKPLAFLMAYCGIDLAAIDADGSRGTSGQRPACQAWHSKKNNVIAIASYRGGKTASYPGGNFI